MQPERQVSIAFAGIGAALVIPELVGLTRHPPTTPGGLLLTGTVLGAMGVFFGSLVVAGHPARSARALGLTLWSLIALAFTGVAILAVVRSTTWGWRILLGAAALLPLGGPALVLARRDQA
jgi:hypothetical protein